MTGGIQPGSVVRCKNIGDGVVTRVDGATVMVRLPKLKDLLVSLPISDVTLLDSSDPSLKNAAAWPPPSRDSSNAAQPVRSGGSAASLSQIRLAGAQSRITEAPPAGRTAIEALRFGLVPKEAIETLTLGYEEFDGWIRRQLPENGALKVAEVCGPFGTGKSHAMAVVRHVAAEAGYLTARVEIDGQRVSLSDPKSLLASLWPTIEGRDFSSSTPLVDVYRRAIERGRPAPTVVPAAGNRVDRIKIVYNTIAHLLQRGHLDTFAPEIESVLCCNDEHRAPTVMYRLSRLPNVDVCEVGLRAIIGHLVKDRPQDFVEAVIGTALVARLAGFKGIILTIDEFEIENTMNADRRSRVVRLLAALQVGLSGELGHPPAPLGMFFASVPGEEHVGNEVIQELIRHTGGSRHRLSGWPESRLRELTSRISSLYANTYSTEGAAIDGPGESVDGVDPVVVFEDVIRSTIKRCVAALDVAHGPPGR